MSPLAEEAELATQVTIDSTTLAAERTRLAHERTLMAWVRTATSMISFGFTIYKFFQFEQGERGPLSGNAILSPRRFAILMVSIGLVSLAMALIGHRRQTMQLRSVLGTGASLAEVVAAIVVIFGIAVLIATILRQ